MAIRHNLLTAEEFWDQYAGMPFELIFGEVVEMMTTGYVHGAVVGRVVEQLRGYVRQHPIGEVVSGETGFQLAPDVVRGADAAFISNEQIATISEPEKYLPFGPALAVEVISPGNTASEMQTKLDLYLGAGSQLVWLIYPDLHKVVVHDHTGRVQTLTESDTLGGGDVLPGLSIPVSELFPAAPEK
jgi:Uma2 family endonuclease